MKLSTTQTLGPLTIEAGYFSGNNIGALGVYVLEWLDDFGRGYFVVFSVSILRVCLSLGIDFDWKRNRKKEGK
jgi:hypothetical protein